MKPTKSIYIGAGVIAVVVAFAFFFLQGNPDQQPFASSGGEPPAFIPPVYETDVSSNALVRPLYLEEVKRGALTSVQQRDVESFKKKILSRISLGTPLTVVEKGVVGISISTTTAPIGNLTIANQTLFHFNADEMRLIAEALKNN